MRRSLLAILTVLIFYSVTVANSLPKNYWSGIFSSDYNSDSVNYSNSTYKIVIVSSYDPSNPCGSLQVQGILKAIRYDSELANKNVKIRTFYMLSRSRNKTTYDKINIAKKIVSSVIKYKPNRIITTDDAAFEFVAIPLILKKYPVTFSGINIPLDVYYSRYPELKKCKLTGVIEVVDPKVLKGFFLKIGLTIPSVYVIYDDLNMFSYYLLDDVKKAFSDYDVEARMVSNKIALSSAIRSPSVSYMTAVFLYTLALRETIDYMEITGIAKQNNIHDGLLITINENCVCNCDLALTTDFEKMGETAYLLLKNNEKRVVKSKTIIVINSCSRKFDKYFSVIERIKEVKIKHCESN